MQNKSASTAPTKAKDKPGSMSPIGTPSVVDVGDGSAAYRSIGANRKETNSEGYESEDVEARGYLRRDESDADNTSIGPDVEMRNANEIKRDEAKATRNRRLTLQQLERFRRAIDKKNRHRRNSSTRWHAQASEGSFDNVFGESTSSDDSPRELRIVNYPWAMWILGALLIIAASIFVDYIHRKALDNARLSLEPKANWWKYLVAGIVYAAGIAAAANGRVETFVMDKEGAMLSIRSTKPLCLLHKLRRTRVIERELRSIVDVRIEASGEILSGEVDTRCYRVHFDFDDGTHASVLEGRSKKKALVRCRLIKQFLLSCAPPGFDPNAPGTPSPTTASGSTGTDGSNGSTLGSLPQPLAQPNAIVLPARSISGNLTLAVPAPLTMPAAAAAAQTPASPSSPRRVMMVASVPSSLPGKSPASSGMRSTSVSVEHSTSTTPHGSHRP